MCKFMEKINAQPNFIQSTSRRGIFNPDNDLIADYYQCLIECDESQSVCKRICKEVLV